jgi:phosphoribosylformylglycinamidine synthase
VATVDTLVALAAEGRVVFEYAGLNPNGSLRDIAGVADATGRIVGLMPHPEHAVEAGFGPDTPAAMRGGVDGLGLFTSVLDSLVAA